MLHTAPMDPGCATLPQGAGPGPLVLVLTPVKDGTPFLTRYFELLERLDYPKDRLALGFLVGNSGDDSLGALKGRAEELRSRYRRVEVWHRDFPVTIEGNRHRPEVQLIRRANLARARNHLLARSLEDEAWVLWLDVDLADYPPDLLTRLLASGKEVVTPNCLWEHRDASYDLNTFIETPLSPLRRALYRRRYTRHGLYQPPCGKGRIYLDACRGQGPLAVDGIGGTVLLVDADLHRDGLQFPAFALDGLIETEGLALMARRMGHTCWGLPDLIVRHWDH